MNNNTDFWTSVRSIIRDGFTANGLKQMESYAELFTINRLVYQRFSPFEQHGCAAGGTNHVIASLLAAAEDRADNEAQTPVDYQGELQRGAHQAEVIEQWARATGVWIDNVDAFLEQTLGEQIAEGGEAKVYDHGATLIKTIGLEYFIQPILALDRITLHNAYFPETKLSVIGFGRNEEGEFKILVEQTFIIGKQPTDKEIEHFMESMGFELRNPRNWTYATPEIYLSDVHDENVIVSASGTFFVIDCDIRINTPTLRQGGTRILCTDVEFAE